MEPGFKLVGFGSWIEKESVLKSSLRPSRERPSMLGRLPSLNPEGQQIIECTKKRCNLQTNSDDFNFGKKCPNIKRPKYSQHNIKLLSSFTAISFVLGRNPS